MAYPLEQGLKQIDGNSAVGIKHNVLMAYPLEQGLKPLILSIKRLNRPCLNGLSTRTRIETPEAPLSGDK